MFSVELFCASGRSGLGQAVPCIVAEKIGEAIAATFGLQAREVA
jgi:hypothetical protein